MRKEQKLTDDFLGQVRQWVSTINLPGMPTPSAFEMPVGTTFNINTDVSPVSPAIRTDLFLGNITNGPISLRQKQQRLWNTGGLYSDPLSRIFIDRHMYLRIDIRSDNLTSSSASFLPGIYPRLGTSDINSSSADSHIALNAGVRQPGYVNPGTTSVNGSSYYTISFVFRLEPDLINEFARFMYIAITKGMPFAWRGETTPAQSPLTIFYGAPFAVTLLNTVKIDRGVANYHRPLGKTLRFTLNHGTTNRLIRISRTTAKTDGHQSSHAPVFNAYYCGGVPTATENYDEFFVKINMHPNYFQGAIQDNTGSDRAAGTLTTITAGTTQIPVDWLVSSSRSISNAGATGTSINISLISGADSIYIVQYYRNTGTNVNETRLIQRRTSANSGYKFLMSGFTELRRGANITKTWNGPIMILIPSSVTVTSSVIEINQG